MHAGCSAPSEGLLLRAMCCASLWQGRRRRKKATRALDASVLTDASYVGFFGVAQATCRCLSELERPSTDLRLAALAAEKTSLQ